MNIFTRSMKISRTLFVIINIIIILSITKHKLSQLMFTNISTHESNSRHSTNVTTAVEPNEEAII